MELMRILLQDLDETNVRGTIMNGEVQLGLAGTAKHELRIFPDFLWCLGAILAADERLVEEGGGECMRHRSGHVGVSLEQASGSVHPRTAQMYVLQDRSQRLEDEYS
jgi:hypothetical protein